MGTHQYKLTTTHSDIGVIISVLSPTTFQKYTWRTYGSHEVMVTLGAF